MSFPRPLQISRRAIQLVVLALVVVTPVLARYANYLSARQLDKVMARFDGSVQGGVLRLTDGALRAVVPDVRRGANLRRDRGGVLAAARTLKGTTWSFELFGLSLTDPLAALESAAASRTVRWVLILGVLLPIGLTILLGRIFCGWLCPIGFLLELTGRLRRVLRFLELEPKRVRLWSANKYFILAGGLLVTFVLGLPFLGYFYPPALIGREVHNSVTVLFDRAEDGMLGFSAAGLTVASWFLLAIALGETALGARLWCRALCPGGAVYSLLGRFRLVRVTRRPDRCTECGTCLTVCQMGLSPMTDRTGQECDNCGVCVARCPADALHFGLPARRLHRARGGPVQPAGPVPALVAPRARRWESS